MQANVTIDQNIEYFPMPLARPQLFSLTGYSFFCVLLEVTNNSVLYIRKILKERYVQQIFGFNSILSNLMYNTANTEKSYDYKRVS